MAEYDLDVGGEVTLKRLARVDMDDGDVRLQSPGDQPGRRGPPTILGGLRSRIRGPTTRLPRMSRARAGRTVSDMNMTARLPTISRFVLLVGFAYLGFYVFGIVMGAFGPGEIPIFTVIAFVVVVAGVVHVLRAKKAVEDPDERHERMREQHDQRERRGF